MSIQHTIIDNGYTRTLVIASSKGLKSIDSSHPSFKRVVEVLLNQTEATTEDEVLSLIDPASIINALGSRVTYHEGVIYFDGEAVNKALTRHILDLLGQGDIAWRGWVRFMENLADNPSEVSKRHLFRWLTDRDFVITEDGCFIAYKALKADFGSIHAGSGFVDGVYYEYAHLPNKVGSVVSIGRDVVNHDRFVSCSTGLHVGTREYAESFGEGCGEYRLVEAKVNPRDVVAVPNDSANQKIRVCRYLVMGISEVERVEVFADTSEWRGWDNSYGYDECDGCFDCGERYCDGPCVDCGSCGCEGGCIGESEDDEAGERRYW